MALQQQAPGEEWQPLFFFSMKLMDTEERSSTFYRELLTVVAAMHHFCFLLEGRNWPRADRHQDPSFLSPQS